MKILFTVFIAAALVVAFVRAVRQAWRFGGWVAWSSLLLVIAPCFGALTLTAWV